jgi:hypothetical protein
MTKNLANARAASTPRVSRRAKGWSEERRARQAALIRGWSPWRRSTGPRTDEGKAISARNATRHGRSSRAFIARLRRIRRALRLAAHTLAVIRAHLRLADASRRRERDLRLLEEFSRADGPAFARRFGHTPPLHWDAGGSGP